MVHEVGEERILLHLESVLHKHGSVQGACRSALKGLGYRITVLRCYFVIFVLWRLLVVLRALLSLQRTGQHKSIGAVPCVCKNWREAYTERVRRPSTAVGVICDTARGWTERRMAMYPHSFG